MKSLNRRRYRQSGLSMIEVLIAILVSVIGLFGVMKMQLSAVSNTHSAYLRSQAAVVSNAIVDQLRANSGAALSGAYNMALTASPPTSGGLEVADLTQWRADLAAILPSGGGAVLFERRADIVCL
ncbi:type IV pilus modification protein PilV [Porticoccaceae bacterium]|nr:type IV pilus modification protein PilV [Porticoccaceae bacterium]